MLWTILIGFIVGVIAKIIMPGKDPKGCIITILLGIGGSVVATYLGQYLGFYYPGERAGFFGAIIGAVIILAIYRAFTDKN
ncbi:MAG: membrane protein [Melioribacteraceae bacterium]|nr:MAG: membrane protein [Melioribacteraceae bacterium]